MFIWENVFLFIFNIGIQKKKKHNDSWPRLIFIHTKNPQIPDNFFVVRMYWMKWVKDVEED